MFYQNLPNIILQIPFGLKDEKFSFLGFLGSDAYFLVPSHLN